MFLNPLVGFAVGGLVGAGIGALSESLVDHGIDNDVIQSMDSTLKPYTSALLVLIRKIQPEKVLAELSGIKGHVLRTSLSPEQEARLQAAISGTATGGPSQLAVSGTEYDYVEEAALESFPASDPPARTGTTGAREAHFEPGPLDPGVKSHDPAASTPKVV